MINARIRRAGEDDLPSLLLDIYNYYIANTHITFDLELRTLKERSIWLSQFAGGRALPVFRRGGTR